MILKPTEEKIYELLQQRATSQDQHGHFCVYLRKQLAIDCGVNEKTVRRILNELEEKKYIYRIWQDDRQAQKIYVLKNVHTPTECENVHTPTECENVHTPTECENVHTVHTPTECENVHTPTECENVHTPTECENVHTPTERENVHTPTECENFHSTNSAENEQTKPIIDMVMPFAESEQETAKELAKTSKYLYFLQNRLTNALGHTSQRSFNNMSPIENSIKTHENVEIKVLSPANFFSSRWNVPTHKVYDLLLHKFSEILPRGKQITAEIIKNNRTVQISVQEFAQKCHIDMKEARQYLNEAISTLYELSIKFEVIEPENNAPKPKRRKKKSELQNKRYIYHRILSERSDDNCNNPVVNGIVTVKLDFDFADFMSRCSRAMPKNDNMFLINGNRHPHSYFMANKLQEHYFMNIGKNNSNRIKVRSLIQDLPDLPTYEEVMNASGDRHIELRIIKPFERNLQALVEDYDIIESWHYCTKNGEFLTDEQLQNYDYADWIEWLIEFRFQEYPYQVQIMRLTEQTKKNKSVQKTKKR